MPEGRRALHDPRWPALNQALVNLRLRHRHALRIVDADCGAGSLLLRAACRARELGFTAIEVRGIDGSPALIGQARVAAGSLADPAIGATFDLADAHAALRDEADFPADIVLWSRACRPGIDEVLSRAADLVIRAPAGGADDA
jgi:2-polyprenyl-3-methyl-5-hydroxy-6-metoxy-1,4-benzoquinol methylase